jgi:hypothetical protein
MRLESRVLGIVTPLLCTCTFVESYSSNKSMSIFIYSFHKPLALTTLHDASAEGQSEGERPREEGAQGRVQGRDSPMFKNYSQLRYLTRLLTG